VSADDDPPPTPAVLRCRVCGRRKSVTGAEVASFVTAGWPQCCGRDMALVVTGGERPADDTPERPPA
jgi:hypothetical protein